MIFIPGGKGGTPGRSGLINDLLEKNLHAPGLGTTTRCGSARKAARIQNGKRRDCHGCAGTRDLVKKKTSPNQVTGGGRRGVGWKMQEST